MINGEIEFDLSCSRNCVIFEKSRTAAVAGNPDANQPVLDREATLTTRSTFQISNAKLNVPVVTLSINHNITFLEHVKQGLRKTISWDKCRSDITT